MGGLGCGFGVLWFEQIHGGVYCGGCWPGVAAGARPQVVGPAGLLAGGWHRCVVDHAGDCVERHARLDFLCLPVRPRSGQRAQAAHPCVALCTGAGSGLWAAACSGGVGGLAWPQLVWVAAKLFRCLREYLAHRFLSVFWPATAAGHGLVVQPWFQPAALVGHGLAGAHACGCGGLFGLVAEQAALEGVPNGPGWFSGAQRVGAVGPDGVWRRSTGRTGRRCCHQPAGPTAFVSCLQPVCRLVWLGCCGAARTYFGRAERPPYAGRVQLDAGQPHCLVCQSAGQGGATPSGPVWPVVGRVAAR